jgi:hypothetical protein
VSALRLDAHAGAPLKIVRIVGAVREPPLLGLRPLGQNYLYDGNLVLYENSSVGRASVQWGGRPRPPTDMAARDGRPTNPVIFHRSLCP